MKYIQFLQAIIVISIIGSANSFAAATDVRVKYSQGHKSIESRLLAVREAIQQHAKPELGSSDSIERLNDQEDLGGYSNSVSQYWNNWGNWPNWRNWGNWGNWGNWNNY